MSNLPIDYLAQNADMCFEHALDNARFNQEQRRTWYIKGQEQKARLLILVGKEMLEAADPEVTKANKQLKAINTRLKDKQKSLERFSETIRMITDAVNILDILVGFIVPA